MAITSISERSILCSIRIVRVTTLTPSNIVWNRLAVVSTTKRVHVHAYIKSLIHTEGGCYPYLPLFLYLRFTYACSFVCISSCGLLPDFFLTSSHAVVFFPCFFFIGFCFVCRPCAYVYTFLGFLPFVHLLVISLTIVAHTEFTVDLETLLKRHRRFSRTISIVAHSSKSGCECSNRQYTGHC